MPFRKVSSRSKKYSTRKRSLVSRFKKRYSRYSRGRSAFSAFRGLKVGKVQFGRAYTKNDVRHAGISKVHEVEHEEVIQQIDGNAIFNLEVNQYINPTNGVLFPWLSPIATCFQCHKWKQLEFSFVTFCGDALSSATNTLGTCAMAVEYNANSYNNPGSVFDIENIDGSVSAKPSRSFSLKVDCRHPLLVHEWLFNTIWPSTIPDSTYPNGTARDIRMSSIGALLFGTQGMQTNALVGELRVKYRVALMRPIPADAQSPTLLFPGQPGNPGGPSAVPRALFNFGIGPVGGLNNQNFVATNPHPVRVPCQTGIEDHALVPAGGYVIYDDGPIVTSPKTFIHPSDGVLGTIGGNIWGLLETSPLGTFVRTLIDDLSPLANAVGGTITDALGFGNRDTNDSTDNLKGFDCFMLGPRKDGLPWCLNYTYMMCANGSSTGGGGGGTSPSLPVGVDPIWGSSTAPDLGAFQDCPRWFNGQDVSPCLDKMTSLIPNVANVFSRGYSGSICTGNATVSHQTAGQYPRPSPAVYGTAGTALGNPVAPWVSALTGLAQPSGQYNAQAGNIILYTGTVKSTAPGTGLIFLAPMRNHPSANNGWTYFGRPSPGFSTNTPNVGQLALEDISIPTAHSSSWTVDQNPSFPMPTGGASIP